jgi:hypothetical protein
MKSKKFPLLIVAGAVLIALLIGISLVPSSSSDDLEEYYSLLNQEGDTSYTLIENAYETGTIDYETSLLYKTYAAFRDNRLPEPFQSDLVAYKQGTHVFSEIRANYDSLSNETQTLLEPFLLRPSDENSYWNQQYQAGAYDSADETAFIPSAHAARPAANLYTEFLVTADDEVKIWYPNDSIIVPNPSGGLGAIIFSADSAKKIAEQIKTILDRDEIIKTYNNYFGKTLLDDSPKGGDSRLDLYVAPTGTDLGWTYGESAPPPTTSYMLINPAIAASEKILETTLAHEIFHVYQYLFKHDVRKDEWWSEATATWSEDFMYPTDNTEQGYLKPFIERADVSLNIEKPPDNHMYGAYIFAYFLSTNYSDKLIADSWHACGNSNCLKELDGLMIEGFKKEWKEFTLWNYNKEPVLNYTDYPSFPTLTSESTGTSNDLLILSEDTQIDLNELKLLTAQINITHNQITDEKIKKLSFENLTNFTGKSEHASLKAIIYYKDGRNEVEDWTDLEKRSFCIDSAEEDFKKVVLITSNSDMENTIGSSQINIKGKESCYHIDQTDERPGTVLHFPYGDAGAWKIVNINTNVEVLSDGEPSENAEEGEQYGYQTKWELGYQFEQIRDAFTLECRGSSIDFASGWTTRDAGIMAFDLSSEKLGENDTFSVDLTFGLEHPKGNYELAPAVSVNCANMAFSGSAIEGYSATVEDIYQGTITNMTDEGATLEIHNACYYGNCAGADGALFQTMETIILEIKKQSS